MATYIVHGPPNWVTVVESVSGWGDSELRGDIVISDVCAHLRRCGIEPELLPTFWEEGISWEIRSKDHINTEVQRLIQLGYTLISPPQESPPGPDQ